MYNFFFAREQQLRTFLGGLWHWVTHDILKIRWEDLQTRNLNFCLQCFGFGNTFDKRERALRFGEEAVELLQAAGLTKVDMVNLINHVYIKEPGEMRKELANAQLTLLALGASFGIHVEDEAERDLQWANGNIPLIREKYKQKPPHLVNDLHMLLERATAAAKA